MTRSNITRRELLKTGAAAASLAAASVVPAIAEAKNARDLTIGVATTGFRTYTNARLAQELAAEDVDTVQLFLTQTDSNYWKYNGRNDLSDLTAVRCKEIADTYRSAGLSIHSIGIYTNLIHPDPAERKANLAYFEAMMKVGAYMNVRTFITEVGYTDLN